MNKIKYILPLFFLFIISAQLINCESQVAKISFVGDIMMHGPVQSSAYRNNNLNRRNRSSNNRGYDSLFEDIKYIFSNMHIASGNMEFPVSEPFITKGLIFNCFPEIIPALQDANFNLLTIANNHIMDQGINGFKNTINFLNNNSIEYIGIGTDHATVREGIIKKIKGIKIGFIAYTGILNYPYPSPKTGCIINKFYEKKSVLEDIKNIKKKCDYLVLQVHTGTEYKPYPDPWDKRHMRKYCEAGVDLIIGHHPHVIQPYELYRFNNKESHIFYSMGNFISNQTRVSLPDKNTSIKVGTSDSIIVIVLLAKKKRQVKSFFKIIPIFTSNKPNYKYKGKHYRNIKVVTFHDEIDRLNKQLKSGKNKKYTKNEIKFLKFKRDNLKRILLKSNNYDHLSFYE